MPSNYIPLQGTFIKDIPMLLAQLTAVKNRAFRPDTFRQL